MTTRKFTWIGLALVLLAPLTVGAQPSDRPGNGNGGGPGQDRGGLLREILPPPGYLQLTDEQLESTRALAQDLRDALEPLRTEQRDLGSQLRDEFQTDAPNPTTIGQLTLDLRAVGEQLRAEIAAFGDAFRAILDPDQQVKWDNFRELRRLSRRQGPPGDG